MLTAFKESALALHRSIPEMSRVHAPHVKVENVTDECKHEGVRNVHPLRASKEYPFPFLEASQRRAMCMVSA